MRRRYTARLILLLAALAISVIFYYASDRRPQGPVLVAAEFDDLPGWQDDDHAGALAAFRRSCTALSDQEPDRALVTADRLVWVRDLQKICGELPASDTPSAARAFFESRFEPFAYSVNRRNRGLLTGYYEPLLEGSLSRTDRYSIPLYRRPPDLVTVDLGAFRSDLRGRNIAGRVANGRLLPMPTRSAIEAGGLEGRGLELLWVDDPVDAFFLHIQGSGRVRLPGGETVRVGYAGPNGHPYTSIGRRLVERDAMALDDVSMQSIRRWLSAHPAEARDVMNENASFVFFRILDGDGPLGAQGVALTAGRSVAVDPEYIPLGLPVYLASGYPDPDDPDRLRRLERLMVAQDTGGAITGPLRADIFWGFGDRAAAIAGRMRQEGRFWVLMPAGSSVDRSTGNEAV